MTENTQEPIQQVQEKDEASTTDLVEEQSNQENLSPENEDNISNNHHTSLLPSISSPLSSFTPSSDPSSAPLSSVDALSSSSPPPLSPISSPPLSSISSPDTLSSLPPDPLSSTSPPEPLSSTPPTEPPSSTSPPEQPSSTSPPEPVSSTSPPDPLPSTSPPEPVSSTSPPPLPSTSPPDQFSSTTLPDLTSSVSPSDPLSSIEPPSPSPPSHPAPSSPSEPPSTSLPPASSSDPPLSSLPPDSPSPNEASSSSSPTPSPAVPSIPLRFRSLALDISSSSTSPPPSSPLSSPASPSFASSPTTPRKNQRSTRWGTLRTVSAFFSNMTPKPQDEVAEKLATPREANAEDQTKETLTSKNIEIMQLKQEIAKLKAENLAKERTIERFNKGKSKTFEEPKTIVRTESGRWEMFKNKFPFQRTESTPANYADKAPDFYISKLVAGPKALTASLLIGLKITLQKADSDWLSSFIFLDGLIAIESATVAFEFIPTEEFNTIVCQCELVACLIALLNNKRTLEQLINKGEKSFSNFVKLLYTSKNTLMKIPLVQLMAALALYSKAGYEMVLRSIEKVEQKQGSTQKFSLIVSLLRDIDNNQFRANGIGLVNVLISFLDKLDHRVKMRSYFVQAGILPILEVIKRENDKGEVDTDLSRQLTVFNNDMEKDDNSVQELKQRLPLQVEDPEAIFKEISLQVRYEEKFLSLLQYLLMIPYDQQPLADMIWDHLLKATHHVVKRDKLPDNTRFDADIFYTILVEDLVKNIENVKYGPGANAKTTSEINERTVRTMDPSSPPPPSPVSSPPPPPPPPLLSPPPPPPPSSSSPRAPPPPSLSSSPPPPPPSAAPPPPPPFGSSSPPPPPPGKGGPPPPLLAKKQPALPPKPAYKPPVKLKQFYWNKISERIISNSNNIWVQIAHRSEMRINSEQIDQLFAAAQIERRQSTTKLVTISILDTKRSTNIAIGLAKIKGLSLHQIAQALLKAESNALTAEHLEMLAKFIPSPEEIEKLKEMGTDNASLGLAEKYFLEIMEIPRLEQKIKLLILKEQFSYRLGELLRDIVIVTKSATQIVESQNFIVFMEGILAVGNYLNSASKNIAQAYGFKLEALNKVADTKAMGRKIGLIHYVIEMVEKVNPQVSGLVEELSEIPKAAAISLQTLTTELQKLSKDVHDISSELKFEDQASAPFREVFSSFFASAKLDLDNLLEEMKKMEEVLKKMFAYVGDDPSKSEKPSDVEDFFKLIVNFRQQFEQALKDLLREKEDAAKAAAKAKVLEESKKSPKARSMSSPPPRTKGVLDTLFDSIKAGNFKTNHVDTPRDTNQFVMPRHPTFGGSGEGFEFSSEDRAVGSVGPSEAQKREQIVE